MLNDETLKSTENKKLLTVRPKIFLPLIWKRRINLLLMWNNQRHLCFSWQ